jgi:primosomal replication protein N
MSYKKEMCMLMNSTNLAGVLKQLPSLTYTPDGLPILRFVVSISDETRAGKRYTIAIPVEVAGDRAETLAQILGVGDSVVISGKLHYRARADKPGVLGVYGVQVQKLTPHKADMATAS